MKRARGRRESVTVGVLRGTTLRLHAVFFTLALICVAPVAFGTELNSAPIAAKPGVAAGGQFVEEAALLVGYEGDDPMAETMLMFVGETAPVVTVASRHPESPTTAPAMVTVVSRDTIERNGWRTLGELLTDQPGIFIATGGRGSVPYLRGMRDSILFLYDGVPMTTDVTKSFAPLDQELSLVAVERVEIVRGPGSVLWGPDAFAGVVNVVPRRGQQQPGTEVGLVGGSERLGGATFAWGRAQQEWDGFFSFSGRRERFHSPDISVVERQSGQLDADTVGSSEFAEAVGTFHYGDWLHLTGRWSDFTRRYAMANSDESIRWAGAKEAPVNLIKATASKEYGPSHYTLTGFVQETDYQVRDADIERQQRNRMSELALLWDRRLLSRGLLTTGVSLRHNQVAGAMVRDGFLPSFFSPNEALFLPLVPRVVQEDFSNNLGSLFTQFRYQWGETEWWLGGRLDDHSQYEVTHSYNLGFHRPLTDLLRLKVVYGTSYRSPYSSQLFDNQHFDPEAIRTISAQLLWFPAPGGQLEFTVFHSHLDNQRAEDPYGGLSLPATRDLYGGEVAGSMELHRAVTVNAALSLFGGDRAMENFRGLLFSFIGPDGRKESTYETWAEPVDQGPDWLASLGLLWRPGVGHAVRLNARTGGRIRYSYDQGTKEGSYAFPLQVDLSYRRPGFIPDCDTVTLRLTNLLNQNYQQPDLFGPVAGPPFAATLVWEYRF
ncbi:MAG: TonB-dependent receptor plug domain-containing protein [Deltaproteobacteria bacterium]|nr:TonB-dependent receptor plug domain-containing protein [Deltaproteobacteria bacterium]